jgi:hypothetical protein
MAAPAASTLPDGKARTGEHSRAPAGHPLSGSEVLKRERTGARAPVLLLSCGLVPLVVSGDFLADPVVVALVVCFDDEMPQVFFRGRLEVVMLVDYGRIYVTPGRRAEPEAQSVRDLHKAIKYMSHVSHLLPRCKLQPGGWS